MFTYLLTYTHAHTQTDHSTMCVAIGRIYAMHMMQPKNSIFLTFMADEFNSITFNIVA